MTSSSAEIESVLGPSIVLWRGKQNSLEEHADSDAAGFFALTKKYVLKEETNVKLHFNDTAGDLLIIHQFKVISDNTGSWRWLTKEVWFMVSLRTESSN